MLTGGEIEARGREGIETQALRLHPKSFLFCQEGGEKRDLTCHLLDGVTVMGKEGWPGVQSSPRGEIWTRQPGTNPAADALV